MQTNVQPDGRAAPTHRRSRPGPVSWGNRARNLRRFLRFLLAALFAYVAAAAAIAAAGMSDHDARADLIVVPGSTVHSDGSLSDRLRARLDAAAGLFQEGLAPVIFVSGGFGREGHDEAAAMAGYLVARGIPSSAIVRDSLGVDTASTASNAAQYLKSRNLKTAIVATQYFHVARTTLALERRGVEVVGTRHARHVEWRDAYSLGREVVGYAAYWATL